MGRRVRLSEVVGPERPAAPEDVGQVRWALSRLGAYDPALEEDFGADTLMSPGLRSALEAFQDRHGLARDALLRPRGPTENRLNFLLTLGDDPAMHRELHDVNGRLVPERLAAFEAAKDREIAPDVLAGRVGPGLENHPRDVAAAKSLLWRHGLLPENDLGAAISRPIGALFDTLAQFQQDSGLAVDGMMNPDGETERALGRSPATRKVPVPPAETRVRKAPPVPRREPPRQPPAPLPRVFDDPAFGAWHPDQGVEIAEQLTGMAVPNYKREYVSPHDPALWAHYLDDAGITGRARRAFLETFIAEGGLVPSKGFDRSGEPVGTVAGLSQDAIDAAGPAIGIPAGTKSVDLTNEQRIALYEAFMALPEYLGKFGGAYAIEEIADEHLGLALFDTLFVHGSEAGSDVIQKAINKVDPENPVAVDGVMGTETFEAYKALAEDEPKRQALLDAIAQERPKAKSPPIHDKARYSYFRFLDAG